MGYELNKKTRKKLISLYKQYLEDPELKYMKSASDPFVSSATHFYTGAVESAMVGAIEIYTNNLPREKAKKILADLEKEEAEDP